MTSPPSLPAAEDARSPAGSAQTSAGLDLPALGAAAAAVAWLLAHTGVGVLDPTNTGWLKGGDWSVAQFGWAFFRSAPFGLPLGANPDYPYQVGSALSYTGSVPPVALLLRPFASVLPADFQFLGPWVALCFALQGFAGAKLVRLASGDPLARALGGLLVGLAPPLLHRVLGPDTGHASLAAHWAILAFLWLALAPPPAHGRLRARVAAAAALLLVTTGIHPYLAAMGLALAFAFVTRSLAVDETIRWRGALAACSVLAGAVVLGLAVFDYLGAGATVRSPGFGYYSANGLALVEPMGWSRLLPSHPIGPGQYEGFAYLGLGVMSLGAVSLAGAIVGRRALASTLRAAAPAVAASVLLATFALSDTVTVSGARVATLGLWSRLPVVAEAFRASGRFVWPLHYVLLLAAIAGATWALRDRPLSRRGVLTGALLLQLADVRPPVAMEELPRDLVQVRSDTWALARGAYRHVALHPRILCSGSLEAQGAASACCPAVRDDGQLFLAADVAARIGATFNSAYLARVDTRRALAACDTQRASVEAGELDPCTIYVVQPSERPVFRRAHARCGLLDGLIACVKGDRADPFARALALSPFE